MRFIRVGKARPGRFGTPIAIVRTRAVEEATMAMGIEANASVPQRVDRRATSSLYDWSQQLGVTQHELRRAIEQVGDRPARVQQYLELREKLLTARFTGR
jgi:hypothetical protein